MASRTAGSTPVVALWSREMGFIGLGTGYYQRGIVRSGGELLILLLGAPVEEIGRVQGDAKKIGGYETELSGAHADHTDDGAIEGGNDPALPELFANEDGGQHSQNTGEIIESNHLEHVQHVWLMNRCRSPL